jgi:hypothetical protein
VETIHWKKSNLGNSLLLAADKTKERAKHTTESKKSTSKGNARFRVGLESNHGVNPRKRDEFEGLVSKEFGGVLSERDFILLALILWEGSLVFSLLECVLDIESFRGKGLGIVNRVADIDVVEEDVLGHSPKLNANSTLYPSVSTRKCKNSIVSDAQSYWGSLLG